MSKLNFEQAMSKFKGLEGTISYFILVESYEKHLSASQKNDFLNANTIDDTISMFNEKQLKHLKSLVNVFLHYKFRGHLKTPYHDGEELSKWFVENVVKKLDNEEGDYYENIKDICKKLIDKIKHIEDIKIGIRKHKKELIDKYKFNLRKFYGNSVEYRQ